MDTPSFVIVGAPHFFSRTTLRPRGPSVTLTVSASWLSPRSRPRRASSLKAMIFAKGIFVLSPTGSKFRVFLALKPCECETILALSGRECKRARWAVSQHPDPGRARNLQVPTVTIFACTARPRAGAKPAPQLAGLGTVAGG